MNMNLKHRKLSLDSSVSLENGGGGGSLGHRRGSRSKKSGEKTKRLEEAQMEIQELGHSLNRSNSLRSQTIEEDSFHRPDGAIAKNSFVKYNKTFHKLFRDIPTEEKVTHAFTCALQKEVLYHGKLFVSVNYVCFYSSVLLKDTKVVVQVSSVKEVKKQNSALSMLSIRTTDGNKYSFVSLRNRRVCYEILQSVCTQAQLLGEQGESGNSSPHFSGENGVDGVDQDIDTISSHSSRENSVERSLPIEVVYPDLPSREPGKGSTTPRSSISKAQDDEFTFTEEEDSDTDSWVWIVTERVITLLLFRELRNLNVLLSIYLFLVVLLLLSSGYIGLRIVALEEQLSSLGALPEFSIHLREDQETA